jgi:hypothetical protein
MKTLKPFGSFFYTLMVVFLFLLDVNLSFAASVSNATDHGFFFSKNNRLPAQADGQFLYEEKETEKDDELQDNFAFECLPLAPIPVFIAEGEFSWTKKISRPKGGVVEIPLYLTKRSLLI